jgi:PAS domain S-box-containing protein
VPEEREVVRALGDLGAMAIDNARLYREAQEATRRATESAALLDTLLETAPIGFGFLDHDLRYVRMNRALATLFGRPAEEYLGRTIMDVIPLLATVIEAKVRHVLTTGEAELNWEVTSRQVPQLPEERGWLVSYYPVRTSDGTILGVGTVVVDITERRRAELALRRSEASLNRAQQLAHLGSWERDMATGCLRWSEETCRIFGVDPRSFGGTYAAFLSYVHPDDRSFVEQALAEALAGNAPYGVDHRIVRPDGVVRVVHEQADVVRNSAGEPVRLLGTVQDITERKQLADERERLLAREQAAHAEAEAERAWLSAVLDQMPEGVVLYDARGHRRFCNQAYLALSVGETGHVDSYGNPTLLDTRLPSGEPMPLTDVPTIRTIERGEIVRGVEAYLRQRGGRLVAVIGSSAPVCGPRGERLGTVGVFQDITVLKTLEREREEWISIVTHDLRQPVTIILGYAGLLANKLAQHATPDERKAIEYILTSTQNLNKMIADLLDVSRIETRRLTIERRTIDLVQLVRDVVGRTAALLEHHPVRLDVRGEVPPVEADPARIEQVLGNLLSNAAKYGLPDSEIQVVVQSPTDAVEVAVTNRGAGISADDLPRLFSRFQRTRQAMAQQIPGLGLGLYISKGLVEAHGGHIWVESIPNALTTFHFTLPLQRETSEV